MVTTKVIYYNSKGVEFPLSSLFNSYSNKTTATIADFSDAIEDSKNSEELRDTLNKLLNRSFILDRERDSYIRLKLVDIYGNIEYLHIEKN